MSQFRLIRERQTGVFSAYMRLRVSFYSLDKREMPGEAEGWGIMGFLNWLKKYGPNNNIYMLD